MKTRLALNGLAHFEAALNNDLRRKGSGPIRAALRAWAGIYASYLRERYKRLSKSKGGGAWPKLALSTIQKKGHSLILIETGLMLEELSVDFERKPKKTKDVPLGVRITVFDDSITYENGKSLSQIAKYHQEGAGNLPKREIVVPAPPYIERKMGKRMEKAIGSIPSI